MRALFLEAAMTHEVPVERLSFKGCVDALLAWTNLAMRSRTRQRQACRKLLERLACDLVPFVRTAANLA